MLKSGASSSFLTSVEVEEEAEHQSVADDRPAVRASVASLLQHAASAVRKGGRSPASPNIPDNDEVGREAVLMQRATSSVHAALASAPRGSAEGPLSFSMRPSSAAAAADCFRTGPTTPSYHSRPACRRRDAASKG